MREEMGVMSFIGLRWRYDRGDIYRFNIMGKGLI